jgi:hypothetical protein
MLIFLAFCINRLYFSESKYRLQMSCKKNRCEKMFSEREKIMFVKNVVCEIRAKVKKITEE